MGAHRGNRAAGLYGGLRVKKNIAASGNADIGGNLEVSGNVNVTGTVTAASLTTTSGGLARNVTRVAASHEAGNGGAFSWTPPEECLVGPIHVYVTEGGGAGRSLDVGVVATATTSGDNLVDGLSVPTTDDRFYTSFTATSGVNDAVMRHCKANQFVTGTWTGARSDTSDIDIYIEYIPIGE